MIRPLRKKSWQVIEIVKHRERCKEYDSKARMLAEISVRRAERLLQNPLEAPGLMLRDELMNWDYIYGHTDPQIVAIEKFHKQWNKLKTHIKAYIRLCRMQVKKSLQ
jgi:hypothetical protein